MAVKLRYREGNMLRALENRVLKKIFGLKWEDEEEEEEEEEEDGDNYIIGFKICICPQMLLG